MYFIVYLIQIIRLNDFKLSTMSSEKERITLELVANSEPGDAGADGRWLFIK